MLLKGRLPILITAALAIAATGEWTVQEVGFHLTDGDPPKKYLPATVAGGFAVLDYDSDGRLDLFFANGADLPSGVKKKPEHSDRLLRNLGGFKFEDVTAKAGVGGSRYHFGAAAADYNGDGHTDLLVTGLDRVTLYRNQGDGTFIDATKASGLDNHARWSVAAAWLDVENDGDADLFIVNYVRWDASQERECLVNGIPDFCHPKFYEPVANGLFLNNGDGTFSDISSKAGIDSHKGKGMSATVADFDGDGLTDIYVTNDRVFAFLFQNRGGGRFEEVAFQWGVAVPEDGRPVSGMGTDAQDFDNDGRADLVLTALRDETFPLFRNTGKEMTEVTAASGLGVLSRKMSGWGVVFIDLDNDGFKDIAAACSDALSPKGGRGGAAMEQPAWFRNGGGRFAETKGWETLPRAMYRGLVAADMNDDGCPDLILTALNASARIVRNPCGSGNNWLKVAAPKLGTRVRVGKQWRHATTAAGYASSYVGPLHFGLGKQTTAEVEVITPDGRSAKVQTPVNRTIRLDR